MDQVPPLFAHALRYVPGDAVRTPFGPGTVAASSSTRCVLPCSSTQRPRRSSRLIRDLYAMIVRAMLLWSSQEGRRCTHGYVCCICSRPHRL